MSKTQSAEKYEINDYRKSILLKILQFANDCVIDQLPFVGHLRKWLIDLKMGSASKAKSSLLIEPVAQIREGFIQKYVINKRK